LLPAIYRDLDPTTIELTEALDAVLAPVWLCLDNIHYYIDAATAPADFVAMLAGWVGLPLDHNWSDDQARRLVAQAVDLYRWRGTRRGIVALVEAYLGVSPAIEETGETTWYDSPEEAAPTGPDPAVRVRVDLAQHGSEDLIRLTRLIANNLPAHVAVTVEIVRPGPATAVASDTDSTAAEHGSLAPTGDGDPEARRAEPAQPRPGRPDDADSADNHPGPEG
jgi:phage tail-like protein